MLAFIKGFFDKLLEVVLSILPDSPFLAFTEAIQTNEFLGYVSYFLPLQQIIAVSEAWLVAITVFYIWQVVLRWSGAIE